MRWVEKKSDGSLSFQLIKTQALLVEKGVFEGRICENDDTDWFLRSDFQKWELDFYDSEGLIWFLDESDEEDSPIRIADREKDIELQDDWTIPVEIVSFGTYLKSCGHFNIPAQFLRPATTNNLVKRLSELSNSIVEHGWLGEATDGFPEYELEDLIFERDFILNEIKRREMNALDDRGKAKKVFLCHSTEDKHIVRAVRNDLADIGHTVWLDEDQIDVGDSIVNAISEATAKCQYLAIFISNASNKSRWVKKEWQAFLMRSLGRDDCKVLPVLLEEAEVPQILLDIKYADFSQSYNDGFDQLALALSR